MPTISTFYGIIVRMQNERGGRHHKPHIHAIYGEHEIVITTDGEILEGTLPKKKLTILQAWIAIHEDELLANWRLLNDGEQHFKIDPLK